MVGPDTENDMRKTEHEDGTVSFKGIPGRWTPWSGGERPVGRDVVVDVVTFGEIDGGAYTPLPKPAGFWRWGWSTLRPSAASIVGYRTFTEDAPEQEPTQEPAAVRDVGADVDRLAARVRVHEHVAAAAGIVIIAAVWWLWMGVSA